MKGLAIFILSYVWKQSWRNRGRSGFIVLTYVLAILAIFTLYSFSRGAVEKIANSVIKQIEGQIVVRSSSEEEMFYRVALVEKLNGLEGEYRISEKLKFNSIIRSEYGMRNVKIIGSQTSIRDPDSPFIAVVPRMPKDSREWDSALWQQGGVLISADLQKSLQTEIGKRLVIAVSDRPDLEVGLPVAGIYQSSIPEESLVNVYVDLPFLQKLLRMPGRINEASIWVPQSEVSKTLSALEKSGREFRTVYWERRYPAAAALISLIEILAFLFSNVVFLALLFVLVNNIIISLDERRKELFILSSIGISNRIIVILQLLEIFFLLLVAIVGGWVFSFLLLGVYWKNGLDLSPFAEGLKTFYIGDARLVPQMRVGDFLEVIALLLLLNIAATFFTTALKIKK